MPRQIQRGEEAQNDGSMEEDVAVPAASDETVLEQTVRMAREGRREREADPKEPKPASE